MRISSMQMGGFVHRQHSLHMNSMAKSMERLASGLGINRAADNASGLAVSQKMRAQLKYLEAEASNLALNRSSLETKDGTLSGVHDILNRMIELTTRAMSDDISIDRYALDAEYQQLLSELERLSASSAGKSTTTLYELSGSMQGSLTLTGGNITAFMDGVEAYRDELIAQCMDELDIERSLLDYIDEHGFELLNTPGGGGSSLTYTVTCSANGVTLTASAFSPGGLGLAGTDLLSPKNAGQALDAVKDAINRVSLLRADIGATLSRLESRDSNAATALANLLSSISAIEDADMAKEMMNFVREQVLTEVSSMVMAHMNMDAYRVLDLLQF